MPPARAQISRQGDVCTRCCFFERAREASITHFAPPGAGLIRSLSVDLSIIHSFADDLAVRLTHRPSGTSLLLFAAVGGAADGFVVHLTDLAAADIGAATAATGPIAGGFNPEGSGQLSIFNGLDASGVWELTITDDAGRFFELPGQLLSWALHVDYRFSAVLAP
jgi:subtilisin-like proprotein convertase family protein